MMATEPKVEISEASVPSNPEPATKLDAEPRDGDAPASQLNGAAEEPANKHISDVAEDLVHSAEVSISGGSVGGSDTEASKSKDDKGHVRTSSSVKKPTGFKSVSVNKTFLAAKSATGTTTPKAGDKLAVSPGPSAASSATAASAARPRLVAKSAGLRDASRSSSANGKPGVAPDASAVWNKNRPPEPKKFTDEELKKYGIHMASRLQTDESKGQANWADIEDDDDDWAPETITWTDGTKITIPHTDEHPPTPVAEKAVPVPVAPQAAAPAPPPAKENRTYEKPKSPAPPTGSPAIKPNALPSGRGLILKGAPEKPTLVAKPPAPPTPVKSPWAPIPKVDTVSPMIPDRTANHSPSRMPYPRDGHHIPKGVTPPPPTKEIAADDFSRSPWRDGPGHGNRELFNSQSGRYEPVTDRRASRPDAHARQPAVLQRSSHHETLGPAEPSAAFQTTHSSANFPSRRRASSNVSGGSGSFMRLGRPHEQPELLDPRRGSFTGDSEGPVSPRNFSPSGLQGGPRAHGNQQWIPRASPAVVHATPHLSPAVSEVAPVPPENAPEALPREDDYEYQKKLMRERRELAMKRRLEQEAKEEAERKERIRLKLEAMGPAPERKSAKKETATKEPSSTPTHIQSRETLPPPQGPPHVETKADDTSEAPATQTLPSTAESRTPSLPNGASSAVAHAQPSSDAEPALPPPDNKHGHPWPGRMASQPDRFTWGPGSQGPRNVWGSPNNDRSLGNGTFITDLGGIPDPASALAPARSISGPGPIGPPSSKASPGEAPLSRPAPIAPPPSRSRHDGAPQRGGQPQQGLANTWIAAVQQSDADLAVQKRDKTTQRERELEARGLSHADIQGAIQDTWRPTKLDEKGQRVSTQETDRVVHGPKAQPAGPWSVSQSDRQAQAQDAAHRQSAPIIGPNGPSPVPQHPRGSRFFPARDVRHEDNAASIGRPHSPSPPPPDMAGHPVFDGDAAHPHVALPPTKPVVRLPPAAGANASTASQRQPNFNWSAPQPFKDPGVSHAHPSRPSPAGHHVPHGAPPAGENWQDRINNLLTGRKPSPPKPVAVDSSSRHALAPSIQHVPATVSLPSPSQAFFTVDNGQITTKVMDEDCFEAQEMGSLPQIRIPQKTPEALWQPALPPKPIPRRFMVATSTSAEPVRFVPEGGNLRVWMPGMSEAKSVALPSHRSRSNPRRGRGGPRYPSAAQRPSNKGRDPSSSFHPPDHGPSGPSGPSAPHSGRGGGRGGFRGRGDNWSRHASTPIQT